MIRLFIPNLLTDQQLEENHPLNMVFPVQPPSSLFMSRLQEELGIWYVASGPAQFGLTGRSPVRQSIAVPFPIAKLISEMAVKNGIRLPSAVLVSAHPSVVDEYCDQALKCFSEDGNNGVIEVSGWGLLEEALDSRSRRNNLSIVLDRIQVSRGKTFEVSKELNDKSWLVRIAEELELVFPDTQIVSGRELESIEPDLNRLLKYIHSSGGGGVIQFDSTIKTLIRRACRESESVLNSKWLLQSRKSVAKDFSVIVGADWVEVIVVEYDQHRLSYLHRPPISTAELEVQKTLVKVAHRLRAKAEESGWQAPFGFDAIVDTNGVLYPAIDMNARLTKGHFLMAVVRHFQSLVQESDRFNVESWQVVRHRKRMSPFSSEEAFLNSDFYRQNVDGDSKKVRFLIACGGMFVHPAVERKVCECTVLEFDRI